MSKKKSIVKQFMSSVDKDILFNRQELPPGFIRLETADEEAKRLSSAQLKCIAVTRRDEPIGLTRGELDALMRHRGVKSSSLPNFAPLDVGWLKSWRGEGTGRLRGNVKGAGGFSIPEPKNGPDAVREGHKAIDRADQYAAAGDLDMALKHLGMARALAEFATDKDDARQLRDLVDHARGELI